MFRDPLSVVTVSIGCGDFLAESAKYNRQFFDKWVIVTDPTDEETRDVARKYRLTCITTEDHKRDGDFSKGRLVERGLQHLPAEGWIMHLDSDIVLPSTFRHDLELAHLEPDCIYGCDRFMVKDYKSWQRLLETGWQTGKFYGHPHALCPPPGFEIGARWVGTDGWCPIGFIQIWNRMSGEEEWKGARVKSYPLGHGKACRTDTQMALYFDRRKRVFLPELYVAHLESEPAPTGANWKGRKTKRFGPELIAPLNTNSIS